MVFERHLTAACVDDRDGCDATLLTGRLDVGIEVDDERVTRRHVERQIQGRIVTFLGGGVRVETLGLEDVEVVTHDHHDELLAEATRM